jgi:DNA-binding MarR family transcriptional regulator
MTWNGPIERRPDPADRRARRIAATGRGTDLLGVLDERLRAAEDGVLGGLAAEGDRKAFRELLARLAEHVNGQDPVSDACSLAPEATAAPS